MDSKCPFSLKIQIPPVTYLYYTSSSKFCFQSSPWAKKDLPTTPGINFNFSVFTKPLPSKPNFT